jgi:thiol-disulfide isomerase/thioredoxin
MTKLLYKILLALISLTVAAQNTSVHMRFKGLKAPTTEVMLPVNETYYFLNKKQYSIDNDSAIHISLHLSQAVMIRCEGYSFIIEPGATKILIDLNKKGPRTVQYKGKNKEGQELYQNWNREFYQYASSNYYKKDTTPSGLKKLIEKDLNNTLSPYDSLLRTGLISRLFYNYVKTDITTYYASVMAHIPLVLYYGAKRNNTRPYLTKGFEQFWKEVYGQYPVMNTQALASSNYYDYASDYTNYKGMYIAEVINKKKLPAKANTYEQYFTFQHNNITQHFKGLFKEYLLANFIGFEMFQDRYQPELSNLFTRFTKAYPKSSFIAGMQPLASKIALFHFHKAKQFTAEQRMVKDYENINTLDQLLALYKNKTVYIDIWATWCGPCKREFAYNEELKRQLKNNDIELLYISMDEADAVEQWNTMIKFYNLQGNHLRASDSLKQDLINKLWKGEGYAIPRYLMVKDSKIINDDALRPGDKEQLYKQLKNAL